MTWALTVIMCVAMLLSACTIKVEPLARKKPIKHSRSHHRAPHPHQTPTPAPAVIPRRPLQLEPLDEPTPFITIPPTAWVNLSTDPLL